MKIVITKDGKTSIVYETYTNMYGVIDFYDNKSPANIVSFSEVVEEFDIPNVSSFIIAKIKRAEKKFLEGFKNDFN